MRILPIALSFSALLAGCQTSALVDDIDLALDFSPLTGPSDALHSPYVAGATFNLWVDARHADVHDWSIVSDDPAILSVGTYDGASRYAPAVARQPGEVTLRIVDGSGHTQHRRTVVVKQPDRIDVLAHGPLLLDDDAHAAVTAPQVLAGGTATFLTVPYAGEERLHGNHALSVVAHEGVVANVARTSFLEDRDWLAVTAGSDAGASSVDLVVGGQTVRTLDIAVVDDAAITSMQLVGESELHRHDKDSLVVVAEASSAVGPVYGVEYDFTVDGVKQTHEGDVYRYSYAKRDDVMLEASHGALVDGALIHSSGGFVTSTNTIGCSAVPGRGPTAPWALLGVLVAIGVRRRRAV